MAQPVFYDPKRGRWKRLRTLLDLTGVLVGVVVVVFIYTAIREPLPKLLLPFEKHPYHALKEPYKRLKETEKEKARERRLQNARRSRRRSNIPASTIQLNADEGIRGAFYVAWDAASFSSLREYARQIDLLYPEWLHVLTLDGRLQGVDNETNRYFDVVHNGVVRPVDYKVMSFLKSEDTGTEVFPLVNNFDGVSWIDISDFLNDPDARSRFRQEIAAFLASDKYRGLMVDFEDFPHKAQPSFIELLNELSSDLHSKGMKLYVSTPANDPDFDYRSVSKAADGVVLMNYDEHYGGGAVGPVASQDWFVRNLTEAKKNVPPDKLICSIANYGYDWVKRPKHGKLPFDERDSPASVQDAWLDARDSDAQVEFDGDSMNPHVAYVDEHDIQHDVWFLDAVTALNEMRAARQLGIRTFALWRLGSEDRSLWRIWDDPMETAAPSKLSDVPPGQDVDMEGNGEILNVEATPGNGERKIELDSDGLITDETMDSLPEPYRVGRYGVSPNQVAITFDDGPDPQWTPKILDVLKREHATATFFLIGNQADRFASITSRIYNEGHEIGNHTFTHPDISELSNRVVELEMNLTESLFASRLGIRTHLFRPPYSIDAEPDTEDEVRPLELSEKLGYITVSDKIDPNDWRGVYSAEQLTSFVMKHLPPCSPSDRWCGNILLLHDGGGNRSETVRALPMIIEGIRAKGIQIVSVGDLLHQTRAEVMPPLARGELWSAWLTWLGFWMYGAGVRTIVLIFFLGDLLMIGRLLFIGAFAIFDRLRRRRFSRDAVEAYQPRVAILIPAYNEEKVIERTIRAALRSSYQNLRVIVIDDGSKDNTLQVARNSFPREQASGRLLVVTKPNSGKADALNFGLLHLRDDEEIFAGIDADTVIARDAVALLVPHFLNPKVAAVAGNAKVGNRVNLWTRWQALEYITSQNFERRALNTLGAVSVVPGAIGAWRTSAAREIGAYHADTVAEDADLTMALLQRGYRVEYEDRALAYTEAPTNANGLMRQRFRWSFGILQAVYKHREAFARKGVLGWVALPNIIVFQILLPLVSPFIDIMFIVGALWYFVQKHFHPESTDPASFQRLVIFFCAFLIIDFITSAIAFALERRTPDTREDPWLLTQVWLQRFAYRQLFSIVLFRTVKRAIKGEPFSWDKLERTAAVTYQETEDSVHVP